MTDSIKNNINVLKTLNILFAEDDELIRQSVTRILSLFFANVFSAQNGVEAVELYKQKKIDVVLLDYVMPLMDGYEVSKFIRTENKRIPIVIASAYTDKEKLLNAIELNLIKYLEKPILYEDLLNVFNTIVAILNQNNMLLVKLDENLVYNSFLKTIIKDDQHIQLSKNEVNFLELLLTKPNQLFMKDIIENTVFGEPVDENTLRNMVYRLRKKIDSDIFVTIKDFGYLIKI